MQVNFTPNFVPNIPKKSPNVVNNSGASKLGFGQSLANAAEKIVGMPPTDQIECINYIERLHIAVAAGDLKGLAESAARAAIKKAYDACPAMFKPMFENDVAEVFKKQLAAAK